MESRRFDIFFKNTTTKILYHKTRLSHKFKKRKEIPFLDNIIYIPDMHVRF